jgi:antitoxin ParD1/3/4
MPTRSIQLTEHLNRFVEQQVSGGRFQNTSEVLRAGLHLLEQQNSAEREKLALLQTLAKEGFDQLDQGQGIEINDSQQLANFVSRIGRRAASSVLTDNILSPTAICEQTRRHMRRD